MQATLAKTYEYFKMYNDLRNQLMQTLTDPDLAFSPGGENPTLGALCVEIGEIQHAYIESFRTFRQNFDDRIAQAGLAESVTALIAWYARLDEDLEQALEALSQEDVESRKIDRGHGFLLPPHIQLDVYKEALLIFYGKVSVYLKMMGKARLPIWVNWIG